MRTSNKMPVTNGDVHVVQGHNGGTISTVIITDARATGRPVEGGANCRDATPSEIKAAHAEGRVKYTS